MAKELVSEAFWERVKDLIPPKSPQPKGGRPWLDDRAVLTGIIFVLRSGIPWEMLPREMVTCPPKTVPLDGLSFTLSE
jgi:transposase